MMWVIVALCLIAFFAGTGLLDRPTTRIADAFSEAWKRLK